jgi:hypothetical protein
MPRSFLKYLCLIVVDLLILDAARVYGQSDPASASYYLDVNSNSNTTYELYDGLLSLKYYDAYGSLKSVPLKVYNWKHEEIAIYQLSKSYGLNYFRVSLGNVFTSWKENEVYTFEVSDEAGTPYQFMIKKVAPPSKEKPKVNISVDPQHVDCKGLTSSVVNFYGEISEGKAPYKVNWYILNKDRTEFLYQPRQEIIETAGTTPVARVDAKPDYYVMLYVKDACGNEQKQMVQLTCQSNKKKINTIFVEPIKELPSPTRVGP